MSKPVRRVDSVAGAVVVRFGAGLFTGLAPAAALAGSWLLAAFVVAAVLGALAVASTVERPLAAVPARWRRAVFGVGALGRLAVGVAAAGTVGRYLTPQRPAWGALVLVVAATVVAVGWPRVPGVAVRVAAVGLAVPLVLVVAAGFAIAPVTPAVAVADGGSPVGFVVCVGLLVVCFLGDSPVGRPVVDVALPAEPGPPDAAPPARRRRRPGTGVPSSVLVVALVAVGCLAVAAAALRQLGAPRLALSPTPVLDALAAADATALTGLATVAVVVGCGFGLLGVLRWLVTAAATPTTDPAPAGGVVPPVRVVVAAAVVVAVGVVLVPPVAALGTGAALLVGDVVLRVLTVRERVRG